MLLELPDNAETAVLRLNLRETISAYEFSELIKALSMLHFSNLWLRLADEAPSGEGPTDPYSPQETEVLYVKHLEIGSPNLIELLGQAVDLLPVASAVMASLGVTGKIVMSLYKDFVDTQKKKGETEKIKIETKILEIDLNEKMQRLQQEAKISEEQVAHKIELQNQAQVTLTNFLKYLVHGVQVDLVEQPVSNWIRISGVPRGVYLVAKRNLDAMGRPDAIAAVCGLWKAYEEYIHKLDTASKNNLQHAYVQLARELPSHSERELHELLHLLQRETG